MSQHQHQPSQLAQTSPQSHLSRQCDSCDYQTGAWSLVIEAKTHFAHICSCSMLEQWLASTQDSSTWTQDCCITKAGVFKVWSGLVLGSIFDRTRTSPPLHGSKADPLHVFEQFVIIWWWLKTVRSVQTSHTALCAVQTQFRHVLHLFSCVQILRTVFELHTHAHHLE